MAEVDGTIENLFQEKLRLYGELLKILEQEKAALFEADTDTIWKCSNQKQALVSEIEKIRGLILDILDEASIKHDLTIASFRGSAVAALVPKNLSRRLVSINPKLNEIKNAIQQAAKLNKAFIEEYLGFIREFVDIIASARQPKAVYTKGRYLENSNDKSLLLNREV